MPFWDQAYGVLDSQANRQLKVSRSLKHLQVQSQNIDKALYKLQIGFTHLPLHSHTCYVKLNTEDATVASGAAFK